MESEISQGDGKILRSDHPSRQGFIPVVALRGDVNADMRQLASVIVGVKRQLEAALLQGEERQADGNENPDETARRHVPPSSASLKQTIQRGVLSILTSLNELGSLKGENARIVAEDLMIIEDFVPSVLWLFSIDGLLTEEATTSSNTRLTTASAFRDWMADMSKKKIIDAAIRVLTLLVKFVPRLRHILWQSELFIFHLNRVIRSTSEELTHPKENQIRFGSLMDLLTGLYPVSRETVEALNYPQLAGEEERSKGAIDFSRFFRAAFWLAGQRCRACSDKVMVWAQLVCCFETYGMSAEVMQAQRSAFASSEASTDTVHLYRDAITLCNCMVDCHGVNPRMEYLYRVKAIEVTMQNRKIARRKERMKDLKVLREIDEAWQTEVSTIPSGEFPEVPEEALLSEKHSRLYLALLILCLEAPLAKSTSRFSDASEKSGPMKVLLQWFAWQQKKPAGGKEKSTRWTVSDLSLQNLTAFLHEKILPDFGLDKERESQNEEAEGEGEKGKKTSRLLKDSKEMRFQYPYTCAQCGKKSVKAKHCRVCLLISYCSKECQRAHWTKKSGDEGEREGEGDREGKEGCESENCDSRGESEGVVCSKPEDCESTGHVGWCYTHRVRCPLLKKRVTDVILSDNFTFDAPMRRKIIQQSIEETPEENEGHSDPAASLAAGLEGVTLQDNAAPDGAREEDPGSGSAALASSDSV